MSEQWALQSYDTVKLQFQDTDLDRHKGELCFALHRFFGRCEDWSVEWHLRKGIRLLFKIHLFGLISNFKQEEKFKITHIFDLVVLSSVDLLQMLLKANFLSRRDSLSAGSGYTISSWKSAHSIIRRHRILHTVQARSTYQSRAHYSLSDNCTSIIFLGKWFRWDVVCVIRPVLLEGAIERVLRAQIQMSVISRRTSAIRLSAARQWWHLIMPWHYHIDGSDGCLTRGRVYRCYGAAVGP